jgi:uncharacterized protein involved in exopolysaccharide biosynthesis
MSPKEPGVPEPDDNVPDKIGKEDETISLMDIVIVITKRKWLIAIATLACAAGTILFSIGSLLLPPSKSYLPNTFKADVIVMLGSPSGSGASSSGGTLSAIAQLAGVNIGNSGGAGATSSDLIKSLMKQNTFLDALASEFSLAERYGMKDEPKTQIALRKLIVKNLKAETEASTGIMTLGYQDVDPEFAAKLVNRAVLLLQDRYNQTILQYSREKMRIVDESISEAYKNMMDSQDRFTAFQVKYGFYDLAVSTTSSLKVLETSGAELLGLESELRNLLSYRDEQDPQVIRLRKQIASQKEYIQSLKAGKSEVSSINIAPDKLPAVASEYVLLKNDATIQAGIYTSLKQQYETMRIEEVSGTKVFSILEMAEVPREKAGPSRGKICAIGTLAGFFVSILLAFVMEYGSRLARDPVEGAKLARFKELLWRRRGAA